MIAQLTGSVVSVSSTAAIIEVGGVGFKVLMPASSLVEIGGPGRTVTVSTVLEVRDDDLSLYGFLTEPERDTYEVLRTVSGIGPKVALAALSTFAPDRLTECIATEDVTAICTISGVGKKLAQRLILELRGKLVADEATPGPGAGNATSAQQVKETLLGMGFSGDEAAVAVEGFDGSSDDAGALLRYALRRLGDAR